MPADPNLVEALERALTLDPTAVSVRLHLTRVLCDGDEVERAWEQCRHLLLQSPDDIEVLRLSATVAERTGRTAEAAAYRRLLVALDQSLAAPPLPAPPPSPAPSTSAVEPTHPAVTSAVVGGDGATESDAFGDEADMFLREVLREHERQHVTLADVGGLDDVKRRVELSFLGPLRNPELRQAYGKSLRGGLLLWGPPGCGKTFLARAIAGELGATFVPVGIHEVLDMYVGNSERNVHAFFEAARRARPSVLFFDEIDAIGHSRTRQTSGTIRNVVAALLNELDGVDADNEGVFVLAATNQPWDVDPALRRPGRLDRTLTVLPPDEGARAAIFDVHLRNRPTSSIDLAKLASMTDGFSGADVRLACEAAVERAFEEASRSGVLQPVTQQHLERAVRDTKPSVGSWLETAKNYVSYANDDGTYDDLAAYLRGRRGRR